MTSTKRVAVVSGGGGGLGAAVSRELAASGAHVCIIDIDDTRAGETAENLSKDGYSVSPHWGDLASMDYVEALVCEVESVVGPPAILVNLAGATRNTLLHRVTDEDFDLVMASHVRSTLNTMRAFTPAMKATGFGRIINTSSVAAGGAVAGVSYSAAKCAIEGMTRSASLELARYGVTVNCVAPGVVETGMFLATPDEFREAQIGRIPMGRTATPTDIAACYRFLASDAAAYITGQTLVVCGGLSVGSLG